MGNFHAVEFPHAFSGDVASIAAGQNVFAEGLDGFPRDDFDPDGGLNGDLELLGGDEVFEFDADGSVMFHVVLVEPEIPPNTGNVIRLCANAGAQLHLIEPLGFAIDHAKMRRAGLDYREFAEMQVHKNWAAFLHSTALQPEQIYLVETAGQRCVHEVQFKPGDALVFGCETRGLSQIFLQQFPLQQQVRLPMRPGNRSLNLSNAVAITVYEAWRQHNFSGGL